MLIGLHAAITERLKSRMGISGSNITKPGDVAADKNETGKPMSEPEKTLSESDVQANET